MKKVKKTVYSSILTLIVITITVVNVQSWHDTFPPVRPLSSRPSKNNVILHALQGTTSVQMFDSLSNNTGAINFPDGFGCYKLSERIPYNDGYGEMYFYKLNCNGRVGYVNAMWVKPR